MIPEAAFANFFPDLLNRIHLGRVRRDMKKDNILRQLQSSGLMPCGTITAKQNDILGILFRKMFQENIHAYRVAIRHDQEEAIACQWLYRTIGIAILSDVMAGHAGTYPFFTPAVFGFADSPKSGFILKYYANVTLPVDNF